MAKRTTTRTSSQSDRQVAAKKAKPLGWSIRSNEDLPDHLSNNTYFADKTLVQLEAPLRFSLSQAVCSYGYFCLAPNRWVPSLTSDDEGYLVRPIRYGPQQVNSVLAAIGQDQDAVLVALHTSKDIDADAIVPEIVCQVSRMLHFDLDLSGFHSMHVEAKNRRFGRLYRSPTLFEDVVKTITNCNMKWAGTVDMNAKLCRHVGGGSFPTPLEIQQTTPTFLKENCRLGYRSEWIWDFANQVVDGSLDLEELERLDDPEQIRQRLLQIKGIGKFASNNILQLMGYYDSFPYDTETVRLWREDFGASKSWSKQQIFDKAQKHYSSMYNQYAFVA